LSTIAGFKKYLYNNKMGQSSSLPGRMPQCPSRKMTKTDFQLCIDSAAFNFQFLNPSTKNLRVSHIDLEGRWLKNDDREYDNEYSNEFFSVKDLKLTVKSEVFYVYLNPHFAPKTILCEINGRSEMYVDMHLKKQKLKPGKYTLNGDCFILCPSGLIFLDFPDANATRPTITESHDQGFLAMYNFFASTQLK